MIEAILVLLEIIELVILIGFFSVIVNSEEMRKLLRQEFQKWVNEMKQELERRGYHE